MIAVANAASLPPARRRLVTLMQDVNFGRVEGLLVHGGEPVFNPPPRVLREFKPGGENGCRPEAQLRDFELKKEVVALLQYFSQVQNATVHSIEIRHGLPLKATVEEDAA